MKLKKAILLLMAVCTLLSCVPCVYAAEAHDHEWKEATCSEPKTCKLCNETEGKTGDHVWTEKTSKKTLKQCKYCKKGFEYYKDPETKEVVAWTEYVLTKEGKRSQPISHYAKSGKVIEWEKDGEVQFYEQEDGTPDMYYVNGKIYYYIPYAYKTSKSTIKKMATAARKKIKFTTYMWTDGNWENVILTGNDTWWDIKGSAWPAVDAGGTKYVIAFKEATEKSPEKYYAIKATW